jgi:hypothetical protein
MWQSVQKTGEDWRPGYRMKLCQRLLPVILLIPAVYPPTVRPQSGRVREGQRPISVATAPAHSFVSAEGKFTIALPDEFNSSRPIKIEGPGETLTGESFEWQTVEGNFTVTYMDTPALISGSAAARLGLDKYRQQTLRQIGGSKGKIISDRDISISGTPGAEIRADMLGYFYTFRGCLTRHRLYELMVATPKTPGADLAVTDRVMDSFKLLGGDDARQ